MMLQDRTLQGLGILLAALASVTFGMMILAFPIGAYVMFETEIGGDINHGYPLYDPDSAGALAGLSVGDAFVLLWCLYLVVFTIAVLGPGRDFFKALIPMMNTGEQSSSNYMVSAVRWFSILVAVSAVIGMIQESAGIAAEPPAAANDLVRFFEVARAPLIEELGFRVVLIGVPLFVMYSHRSTVRHFFRSLWHPYRNLHVFEMNRPVALIILSAALFGVAHISGDGWGADKLAQAVAGGMVIGWAYFRYGLVPALLIHWATNYLVYSYAHLVAEISLVTVGEAFSHPMLATFEVIFLITGAVSIAMIAVPRVARIRGSVRP